MKILIITDGIQPFVIGGMQKHSFSLAKNLALLGHQITLVHCVNSSTRIPGQEEIAEAFGDQATANLEVIGMKFPKPSWYPGHYLNESYLYSKLVFGKLKNRLTEFDFIYAKGFTAWYFLDKKLKGTKMPNVGVKFHGYEMFQEPANLKMRLHNWMLSGPTKWNNQHADFIFSYGGKITGIIESIGVHRRKIIEIPTGIDSSWIAPKISAGEKTTFVFIGRYERRKGIEELTQTLRNLVESEKFQFHFIGPIPPSARIKSEQIKYHGSLTDKNEIRQILDNAQVLVVPSHSEGMPNVIMEGMSRGLAIIATDVGAVGSAVSLENGWFVTPGDVQSLHHTLKSVVHLPPNELISKQEASLRKIRDFTWEAIAARTANEIAKRLG